MIIRPVLSVFVSIGNALLFESFDPESTLGVQTGLWPGFQFGGFEKLVRLELFNNPTVTTDFLSKYNEVIAVITIEYNGQLVQWVYRVCAWSAFCWKALLCLYRMHNVCSEANWYYCTSVIKTSVAWVIQAPHFWPTDSSECTKGKYWRLHVSGTYNTSVVPLSKSIMYTWNVLIDVIVITSNII